MATIFPQAIVNDGASLFLLHTKCGNSLHGEPARVFLVVGPENLDTSKDLGGCFEYIF